MAGCKVQKDQSQTIDSQLEPSSMNSSKNMAYCCCNRASLTQDASTQHIKCTTVHNAVNRMFAQPTQHPLLGADLHLPRQIILGDHQQTGQKTTVLAALTFPNFKQAHTWSVQSCHWCQCLQPATQQQARDIKLTSNSSRTQ